MPSPYDGGRDTALPSPLYHSGAAGIDIISDRSRIIHRPGWVFEIVGFWQLWLVNPSTTLRASPAPTIIMVNQSDMI